MNQTGAPKGAKRNRLKNGYSATTESSEMGAPAGVGKRISGSVPLRGETATPRQSESVDSADQQKNRRPEWLGRRLVVD